MELILKRVSDLPQQAASSLTGNEFTLISNNGVIMLAPLSAIYQYAQSQLSNVANLSVVTLSDIQNGDFTDTYVTYDLLAQAIQSLGVLLTPSQQQALLQHLVNYNNPHRTTAEQVGLGNVVNLPILTQSDLAANNFGNKYITYNILQAAVEALGFNDLSNVANYPPTTLADIQNGIFGQTYLTYNLLSQAVQSLNIVLPPLLRTEFLQHLTNYSNPHQTTATQIGLGQVVNLPVLTEANIQANDITLEAYVTYNLLGDALASLPNSGTLSVSQKQAFLAHLVDYSNPHEDTSASVGLGNVANLLPISSTDITDVNNGQTPPDVYVTYDLLALANGSLGYKPLNITEVLVSGNASSSTVIDITINLLPAAGVSLTNSSLAIQYKETNSTSWQLANTVSYSGSNTLTQTITGLTAGITYDVQVTMSNSVNTSVSAVSNTLVITTLSSTSTSTGGSTSTASGTYSYDIIGVGGGATSPFDATTVNAGSTFITNNQAIVGELGAGVLMQPLIDPSGDGNFTQMNPTMTIIPGTVIVPLSGSTTSQFLITQAQYSALSAGEEVSILVGGTISKFTIGTNISLSDSAGTTSTSTSTGSNTVPAGTATYTSDYTSPPLAGSTPTATESSDAATANAAYVAGLIGTSVSNWNFSDGTAGGTTATITSLIGTSGPYINSSTSNHGSYFIDYNNEFAISYPSYTTPTLVTYTATAPASYYLEVSTPLSAVPTAIFNGGDRSPVGAIYSGTTSSTSLPSLAVESAAFNSSNGAITYTYNPITGNGTSALTGFQSLFVNDIVVEFKGTLSTSGSTSTATSTTSTSGSTSTATSTTSTSGSTSTATSTTSTSSTIYYGPLQKVSVTIPFASGSNTGSASPPILNLISGNTFNMNVTINSTGYSFPYMTYASNNVTLDTTQTGANTNYPSIGSNNISNDPSIVAGAVIESMSDTEVVYEIQYSVVTAS